jgi:hypothetical protein
VEKEAEPEAENDEAVRLVENSQNTATPECSEALARILNLAPNDDSSSMHRGSEQSDTDLSLKKQRRWGREQDKKAFKLLNEYLAAENLSFNQFIEQVSNT